MANPRILIWLLPVFSGILLILGYPPFGMKILPFLSFIPLLLFLNIRGISSKKCFLAGLVAGFIFMGDVMFWMFDCLPLTWLGVENSFVVNFVFFATWFLLVLFCSLLFGLFGLVYCHSSRGNFWDVLLIPSLWVILEYLRTWIFTFSLWGKESVLGAHWTFGNLAYSAVQIPVLRFMASIGGIYLISFLIVLINCIIFIFLKNILAKEKSAEAKVLYSLPVFIILIAVFFSYFFAFSQGLGKSDRTINIAVLQSKVPSLFFYNQTALVEKSQTYRELVKEAVRLYPETDIFVLPEGSNFLNQTGPSADILNGISFPKNSFIIDSGFPRFSGKNQLTAIFYDTKINYSKEQLKMLLSPFGEYLPYVVKVPALLINRKWVESFERTRGSIKSKTEEAVVFSDSIGRQMGALFCSESLSPYFAQKLTEKGAQAIIDIGSLSFSHGSRNLDRQVGSILQFRAAESNKYLVGATNYGTSYVIDNTGEIIKSTADFDAQILPAEINLLSGKTPYHQYGDWVLIFVSLVLLLTKILNRGIMRVENEHL